MARTENQKLKVLVLERIFLQETDERYGLTMPEIMQRLAQRGVSAERKSVYRDIEALRSFGLDIRKRNNGTRVEYALASRTFDVQELMLMADAVQSSRFLTPEQAETMVDHLKTLAPTQYEDAFEGRVHVAGRVKTEADEIFKAIDTVRNALASRMRIEFKYFEYSMDGTRVLRREGAVYVETPVCLMYVDNLYYAVTYNSKHKKFLHYRVDRMCDVRVSEKPAARNEKIANFDVEKFEQRTLGMYSGRNIGIKLLVHANAFAAFKDRFGKSMHSTAVDEDHARIDVHVAESPVLYGWLAQFGDACQPIGPKSFVRNYRAYLEGIVSMCDRTLDGGPSVGLTRKHAVAPTESPAQADENAGEPAVHVPEGNPAHPEGAAGDALLDHMNTGHHEQLANWGLGHLEIPAKARMLDVGCGGGANLARLLERCPDGHATGVDYAELSVEKSRAYNKEAVEQGACDVLQADVANLPFDDASFDVVTAFETVYFWPNIQGSFLEVARVMKDGAAFLVCNEANGARPQDYRQADAIEGMTVYTAAELEEFARAAGLTVDVVDDEGEAGRVTLVARK